MKRILFSALMLAWLAAGCSQSSDTNSTQGNSPAAPVMKYEMGSNDWASLDAFAPKDSVKEAYRFAVDHPEVLDYMPCYCGCDEDGHTSNTDCFVDQVEDNVAILDNMGLG